MDFSFIPAVSAATTPILDASVNYTTSDMLRIAISLIVLVAMVCAVFFIVYGGLMLVLSGGDDKKVSSLCCDWSCCDCGSNFCDSTHFSNA